MPVQTTVQMRRDTAANWTSTNPTLASGEWGLETDTRLMKIGDGTTAWNSLAYQLGPMLDEVIATDPTGGYFTGSGFAVYGNAGNFASTPDAAALDITGDIDIRAKVALDDWTPVSANAGSIVAKWSSALRSYALRINTNGTLGLIWSSDGTAALGADSTVATGVSDGATKWVRVTLDVNNGASGRDITFYLSDDGTTWTQLGNVVTQAGTTSIYSSAHSVYIGSDLIQTTFVKGTIYRAQVLNGIGGTVAFDANFESVAADSFAFSESSANAATVTLTTTRYSFGLPSQTLTGTGTTNVLANRTWYAPFTVRGKPITLKHLAFECTSVPASTSSVRIAIYSCDSQLQPIGTRLFESGAISVATTAAAIYRTRITPTVFNPGNYIIAFNPSVQFTSRIFRGGNNAVAPNTMGANLNDAFFVNETLSGGALPSTGTKWNIRGTGNAAYANVVVLGWS